MPEVTRVDDGDSKPTLDISCEECGDGYHESYTCAEWAEKTNHTFEHQRLKDEIVEAAVRQHQSIVGAKKELAQAVTALIEFEKQARAE